MFKFALPAIVVCTMAFSSLVSAQEASVMDEMAPATDAVPVQQEVPVVMDDCNQGCGAQQDCGCQDCAQDCGCPCHDCRPCTRLGIVCEQRTVCRPRLTCVTDECGRRRLRLVRVPVTVTRRRLGRVPCQPDCGCGR